MEPSDLRFPWLEHRGAGLLLHPTSLPGPGGIGTLGDTARAFVDYLAEAGLKYWQILPLGPLGYGNSPYSAYSVFAGNPLLIDFDALADVGLLDRSALEPLRALPHDRVDFDALQRIHRPLLGLAARRFRERGLAYLPGHERFEEFCRREAAWLEPFALFMALKEAHGGRAWYEWSEESRNYHRARAAAPSAPLRDAIAVHQFAQYVFALQWAALRRYANEREVRMVGDLPIYAAGDSADVWSGPEVFELDTEGRPRAMAGVPPDYFSATGQLWGNPLYDWKHQAATGFEWWMRRLRRNFVWCDVIRLDHFRAFYDFWAVPAGADDARGGEWRPGPQMAFFEAVHAEFGAAPIIAEDLGEISDGVREFLARLELPGMAVLQFAFDGQADNLFLPHNLHANSVVYPGTHDNDTTAGWYASQPGTVQDQVRRYLRVSGDDIAWDFIRAAFASVSRLCVLPVQDLLGLGSEARMNRPGVAGGNWGWRLQPGQFAHLRHATPASFRELTSLYGR
jgi:4-alpha-glucanotransferase